MSIIWDKKKYCQELMRRIKEQVPNYLATMLIEEFKGHVPIEYWERINDLIVIHSPAILEDICKAGVFNYREDQNNL